MKMRRFRATISLVALVVLIAIPMSSASVCTLIGYVTDSASNPSPEGLKVQIIDFSLGTVSETATGSGWPNQNMYVRSFTCNFGDRINVSTAIDGKSAEISFIVDHYPYEANLSFASEVFAEPIIIRETEKGGSSGGGGGSGGSGGGSSGGGITGYDFGIVMNQSKDNIIPAESKIRLYIIGDNQSIDMITGNVRKISNNEIEIAFKSKKVRLKLGEADTLDLNEDGKDDVTARAIEITDDHIVIRFDRILPLIEPIEKNPAAEKPAATVVTGQSEAYEKSWLLFALIGILGLLILFTIYEYRRGNIK
jgi:hypothetical protein